MECAKPASAPAYARRWDTALQKSLFFILYHIFFKKSSVQFPGLVAEPVLARSRVRICECRCTRQHIRTASPSDMGSHSAASCERKRAQRQARIRAYLPANAGAYGGASPHLPLNRAHMGSCLACERAEAGVSGG